MIDKASREAITVAFNIERSVSFLEIGNPEITYPLFAYTYLAPLTTILNPMPNFSLYACGNTGTFKTTIALLALRHFGNFDTAGRLPGFNDPANSLEKRAYHLKDTLMLIDDYSAKSMDTTAQRIVSKFTTRTGDSNYEPRGLLLVTGERTPKISSELVTLKFKKGYIDKKLLSNLQRNSKKLPRAMASYILWLQPQIETIKTDFNFDYPLWRDMAFCHLRDNKMAEMVAFLYNGLFLAIEWMKDLCIIRHSEAIRIIETGWAVFLNLAKKQKRYKEGYI